MSACCAIKGFAVLILSLQIIKKVLPWFYNNLIGPKLLGSKVDLKKMGKWALITGATDGIGKAYARALAKKGLNLVLVSRSPSKLEAVSNEIAKESRCEIKTIDVDFTKGPEIYEKIQNGIKDLEIGVLVNNVGISLEYPEYFLDISNLDTFLRDIVSCNIHSVTYMTKTVLPGMVERKQGVIINLSSLAAVIPNPMLSVYSASKAFVDKFSGDLNSEYKSKGIIVQSIMPGFVCSNMSKVKKSSFLVPSSDGFVASALQTIGFSAHTTGYFPHTLLKVFLDSLGFVVSESYANNFVLKSMLGTRKKALRNKNKNN